MDQHGKKAEGTIYIRAKRNSTKNNVYPNNVEKQIEVAKLDNIAKRSERLLLHVKTVFPFKFFSDEIVIDDTKVSVVANTFFFSSQVRSVMYEDISSVTVEHNLIFATVHITDRNFRDEPLRIPYLFKPDAIHARRVIQGLIIAKREKIDLHKIPAANLVEDVIKLGTAKEEE